MSEETGDRKRISSVDGVFEYTGESRVPDVGEWYENPNFSSPFQRGNWEVDGPRKILRAVKLADNAAQESWMVGDATEDEGHKIISAPGSSPSSDDPDGYEWIATVYDSGPNGPGAHALLIAAAPDLKRACQDLLSHASVTEHMSAKSVELARAAIAKATGAP